MVDIYGFLVAGSLITMVSPMTAVGVMVMLWRVGAGRRLDEPALPAQA